MLSIEYEVADDLPSEGLVEIRERRGSVTIRVSGDASIHEIIQALNPAVAAFLRGGRWSQQWKGEIITADSPARLEGNDARIRRGSLVHKAS